VEIMTTPFDPARRLDEFDAAAGAVSLTYAGDFRHAPPRRYDGPFKHFGWAGPPRRLSAKPTNIAP
jgi:hypothetical protein